MSKQRFDARAPQLVAASSQLGKEQALPGAKHLGMELDLSGACLVSAELSCLNSLQLSPPTYANLGTLDRALTALTHQLPQVTGCIAGPAELPAVDSGKACVDPDGQHGDGGIYKLPGQFSSVLVACHNLPAISSFGLKSLHATHIPGKSSQVKFNYIALFITHCFKAA